MDPPLSINPYTVLSLPPTANTSEIRRAYHRLALTTHPDKVASSARESAHLKFQELAFAYAILSDPGRRKRYDDTGSTRDDDGGEGWDWKEFFEKQFRDTVSVDAVERFKEEYQGSEEERLALLQAYTETQGSLDKIFEIVMVSSVLTDEDRFRKIIDQAIKDGEVEAFPAYKSEGKASRKRRVAKATKESREAEEYAKELGVWDKLYGNGNGKGKSTPGGEMEVEVEGDDEEDKDVEMQDGEEQEEQEEKPSKKLKAKPGPKKKKADDTSALEDLIKSRMQSRMGDLIGNIEAKYGASGSSSSGPKKKKQTRGKKTKRTSGNEDGDDEDEDAEKEPTEEEFQAAKKKLPAAARNSRKAKANGETSSSSTASPAGVRRSKRVKTG